MVRITPYGAAGEVTGSAYLIETSEARLLVDFGMFQGDKDDDARNVIPGHVHREKLHAVLLTHGHLDHSGRLPLLVREGYRGPIYATSATRDIAEIILRDSAHIQESDFQRRKRRAQRHGHKMNRNDVPMYEDMDVDQTLEQFVDVDYGVQLDVCATVSATYYEAGHMLGSASILITVNDEGTEKRILFSGDVGPPNLPYLRDPEPPSNVDVVVMESTYGDRDHRSLEETLHEFENVIVKAVSTKGKVFIPSFAIGRAQQILYYLADLIDEGRIPSIPIYVDSPMAIKSVAAYRQHSDLFDAEAKELVASGVMRKSLRSVRFCETADDSRAINNVSGPFIVIAGSGMCTAGRIMHHIRNNIDDPTAHFIIAGYQSHGSLGRKLVDGVKEFSIMGDYKRVRATIHTLGGFSAHAGQSALVDWFAHVAQGNQPAVVLTHGENDARTALASILKTQFNVIAQLPLYSEHMEF